MPRPAALWREGVDFTDQAAMAELADKETETVMAAPRWAVLVMEALRELRLAEATGELPGGRVHSQQPTWKVELWEAFWWGQLRAKAGRERECR